MAGLRIATFLSDRLLPLYERAAAVAGDAVGRQPELVSGTEFATLAEGEIDAAFLCGLPYVGLRDRVGDVVQPLVAPVVADPRYGGQPLYASDLIARAGETATTLEAMAGARLAVNEPDSHSGWSIVLATLTNRGVPEGSFAEVVRTGGHAASVAAVRSGAADVAAIDSHVLSALRAEDPAIGDDLTVIEALGPSPSQPLAAGPTLGAQEREAIAAALAASPAVDVAPGLRIDWAQVDDASYDPIRAMRDRAQSRAGF